MLGRERFKRIFLKAIELCSFVLFGSYCASARNVVQTWEAMNLLGADLDYVPLELI